MATRIAHLSDLHLGLTRFQMRTTTRQNQREADFQIAIEAVVSDLIARRPDVVLVAGDTFDKFHVGTAAELGAVQAFRALVDAGLPVVIIGGNHDQPHTSGGAVSLDHLAERGVEVHQQQGCVDLAGVRLHLVPYRTLSRFYGHAGQLAPFEFSSELPNVLVAHGYAHGRGVTYPPEPVEIPSDWIADPRFTLICLGHVHTAAQIHPNAFYGGVIERTSFDEAEVAPGFWVHVIDDGKLAGSERVKVADLGVSGCPRPMFNLPLDCAAKTLDELSREVEALLTEQRMCGAMVTLTLAEVSAEFSRRTLRRQWDEVFRAAGGFSLEVNARPRRVSELLDIEFTALPSSIPDRFEEFVRAQEFGSGPERAELLDLGLEILDMAHEQLAQEAVK